MSVKIMSLVWERAPYAEGSLLVLLALADWANDEGVSWPSIPKLAHKARLQRRRVQYIIRKLQSDGFVEIEEGGGRKKQHKYSLNLEKLKGAFIAPFINGALDDKETVHFGAETVHSETQTVHWSAPDPLVDPSEEPSLDPPYVGEAFKQALTLFRKHRTAIKKPLSLEAERLLYGKLSGWGERDATRALEDAVINRWQGVFEPRHNGQRKPPLASFGTPDVSDLPPLPAGVKRWSCVCGFSVLRNGNGINTCPDCGGGLLSEYERQIETK